MAGNIFVYDGNDITELRESQYESEDFFQSLIERFPNILAGEQINQTAPRKWVLISREMGIPDENDKNDRWSLDHLLADQDAIPTFVEVKRSTDTRIRREVVAQMLDYAANATEYWSLDKIRMSFTQSSGSLLAFDITTESEEEDYWKRFEANLRTGKIRLLFVADEIPLELRRIIEFLNDQMQNTEVLGLEIKQYASDGHLKTLVPRIIGQTAKAIDIKNVSRKIEWNKDKFFAEAEKISDTLCEICKRLVEHFEQMKCRILGGKTTEGSAWGGSLAVWYENFYIFILYVYKHQVMVEIGMQYYKPPYDTDESQLELITKLNEIQGVALTKERIHKRPNINVEVLSNDADFTKFTEIFNKMVEDYKGKNGDK